MRLEKTGELKTNMRSHTLSSAPLRLRISFPQASSSGAALPFWESLSLSLISFASRYSFGGFVDMIIRLFNDSGEGNSFKHSEPGENSVSPNV
jgi:hypothetical protein